ncbi:MAG: hypothetical protein RLY71_387 [Pseudomonadota bacterium]|jgi:DNA-binding XRE family transcriptional regulator
MKTSAHLHLLPFEVEDVLLGLGRRVAVARKARGLTQPDLAAKAGIGMSTMVAIEKGAPTVQFGFWLNVLWALDLLEGFADISGLGRDAQSVALMEEHLPQRVRRPRTIKSKKAAP